ncbi:hypothetical protein [Desulfovibrio inopinatus]|uniref:hypothetical protein n=1 Tax=Desulfovibrio inopinatus TaxID=102109 RepID=UPI0003FEC9F0|nr:hypothetical protein [Desulfovibrio inopinatus]
MEEKQKFGVQMEEKLKDWKQKIDGAKQSVSQKEGDYLEKYAGDLERLTEKYDAARYSLTLLQKASGGAWGELKEGFDKAYDDMKKAVTKAFERF